MLKKLKLFTIFISIFTILGIVGCGSDDSVAVGFGENSQVDTRVDLNISNEVPLSDIQKYALAYMWNE